MHESTVSRVTTNKYVHTPQGIFELKYFFNSGIARTDGDDLASEAVKLKIKQIIARRGRRAPALGPEDRRAAGATRASRSPAAPWRSTASSLGSCRAASADRCSEARVQPSARRPRAGVPTQRRRLSHDRRHARMQLSTTFRHMDASQAVQDLRRGAAGEDPQVLPRRAHRGPRHLRGRAEPQPHGRVPDHAAQRHRDPGPRDHRGHVLVDRSGGGAHRAPGAQVEGQDPRPQAPRRARASRCASGSSRPSALEPRPGGPARLGGRAGGGQAPRRKGEPAGAAAPAVSRRRRPAIKVIKEQTFTVRAMRVDDAVMQMNLLENEFFVFLDVDTKAVSVVYRRKDGNYGLIETGGAPGGLSPVRDADANVCRALTDELDRASAMKVVDFLRPELVIAQLGGGGQERGAGRDVAAPGQAPERASIPRPCARCWRSASCWPRPPSATASPSRTASSTRSSSWWGPWAVRSPGWSSTPSTASRPTWSSCWWRPSSSTGIHLKALARLSRLFRDADFRRRLIEAPDARGDVPGDRRRGRQVLRRCGQ